MIPRRHKIARQNAFTLLEVLVAMTIVGIGVVTLMQVFSLGLRLGARSSAQTDALAYGRLIMDGILARPKLEDSAERGTFEDHTRWQLQVKALHDPSTALTLGSNFELKEVALDVNVTEAGRERRIEFKTLRLARKKN